MAEEFLQATVESQTNVTDVLRILKVESPVKLDFLAGQFTKIGLQVQDEERPLMRAYSFVNSPDGNSLEFYYDVLTTGGNLTPMLDKLSQGDTLLVSERVNGLLHIDNLPEAKSLYLVASGTGIGPFLSILGTRKPWTRFERIVLVWSVREKVDLVYQKKIEAVLDENRDQFSYVPIVTREQVEGVLNKRITEVLVNGELEDMANAKIDATAQFMLCGNPEMVQQMSDLLKERGLERNRRSRPGNVTIEKYW